MVAIIGALADTLTLMAQAADAPGGGPPAPDNGLGLLGSPLILMLALFAVFYFIILRPQRREQAHRRAMLAAVKKNDRVITIGGIYGVVTNVRAEDDELTIKVDEATNTKLRITLSSVARVLGDAPSEETSKT